MNVFDQVRTSLNLFHLLEGLVAVNRVDVIVVVRLFPVPGVMTFHGGRQFLGTGCGGLHKTRIGTGCGPSGFLGAGRG